MTSELKLSPGDVFRFGSSMMGWAYGQILISGTLQFVVVFKPIFQAAAIPPLVDVVRSPILLNGWTMDARIQSGSWEVLGNTSAPPAFSFPEYAVEIEGRIWVTDVEGRQLRQASQNEKVTLRHKSSHSPIAYEKAFWAFHTDEWERRFDGMLIGASNSQ